METENEFQVDLRLLRGARTPSRAATAIVKRREVTGRQEIYTPCQTAASEKSTGGATINNGLEGVDTLRLPWDLDFGTTRMRY